MAKQRAFVKYTKSGKIIPGSLIVSTKGGYPINGLYTEVPTDLCCDYTPFTPSTPTKTRAFVKYTKKGKIIPGSLIITTKGGYPTNGLYYEVPTNLCCVSSNDDRVAYLSGTGDCCPGGSGRCSFVTIYLLQSCIDNPQIGCQVWGDEAGTIPVSNASYFINSGAGPLYVTTLVNGSAESFVISITPCT